MSDAPRTEMNTWRFLWLVCASLAAGAAVEPTWRHELSMGECVGFAVYFSLMFIGFRTRDPGVK